MALADCYPLIIKIGKGEVNPKDTILPKYFPENSRNKAWYLYDKTICDKLTDEELVFYYKGFVRCEKELNWILGSTAPSLHVYQHLKVRGVSIDSKN